MYIPLKLLFVLSICLPAAGLSAQDHIAAPKKMMEPGDSIFLELRQQRKFLRHVVEANQTLFALSTYYGLSLDALYAENTVLQTQPVLQIGQVLHIPLPNKAIIRYPGAQFNPQKHARLYYRVRSGDNLYNISTRYFDMSVDSVMKRNRLTGNTLKTGQVLHMGWMSTSGIPAEWQTTVNTPQGQLRQKYEQDKDKYKEYYAQGVCFWQKDKTEEGQYYALHKTALIGATMYVENPMSHRKTAVKVIGRIPDGFDPNIEVILSPAAARYLGALDARFFVKTTYLK
jgi:LysM repeat protein